MGIRAFVVSTPLTGTSAACAAILLLQLKTKGLAQDRGRDFRCLVYFSLFSSFNKFPNIAGGVGSVDGWLFAGAWGAFSTEPINTTLTVHLDDSGLPWVHLFLLLSVTETDQTTSLEKPLFVFWTLSRHSPMLA